MKIYISIFADSERNSRLFAGSSVRLCNLPTANTTRSSKKEAGKRYKSQTSIVGSLGMIFTIDELP